MNLRRILLLSLLLLASFKLPLWHDFDLWLFRLLNDSVKENYFLQVFWALANVKLFDLLGAVFIITFSFVARVTLVQFLYYLIWFEIGIFSVKELLFPLLVACNFLRDSPTLVCQDTFFLSNVIPWLKIKDSSHWSYPSDHALIMLEWVGFIFFYKGIRIGILAAVSSLLFIVPRLVGGAHWATDVLLGSLPIALLFVGLACYTPLYAKGTALLERLITRIFRKRYYVQQSTL